MDRFLNGGKRALISVRIDNIKQG